MSDFTDDAITGQITDLTRYVRLITTEHVDKPKFVATVTISVQPFIDEQNLIFYSPELYDLDTAVGTQLDVVGLWVGVTRYTSTPLTGVYFAFDTVDLGFDQGVWQGAFDPTTGIVCLIDSTYRLLLKARILANHWDGTVSGAMGALSLLFNESSTPNTKLFLEDNFDMTMTFIVAGQLPNALFLALLASGALGIKPVGVGVNYLKTSVNGDPVFGFDVQNDYISGFDVGAWAEDI